MQQIVLFSQRTVQLPSMLLSQTQAELTWPITELRIRNWPIATHHQARTILLQDHTRYWNNFLVVWATFCLSFIFDFKFRFTNIFVWFLQFSQSWETGLNNAVYPRSDLLKHNIWFILSFLWTNSFLVILIIAGAEARVHGILDNVGDLLNIKQLLLIITLKILHDKSDSWDRGSRF